MSMRKLAGRSHREVLQLAGAVEAINLFARARGGDAAALRALDALIVEGGPRGGGAAWAVQPYLQEIAALGNGGIGPSANAQGGLSGTSGTCMVSDNVPRFDKLSALVALARGDFKLKGAHASAESQTVVLSYLIAEADEQGRARAPVPVLAEKTPLKAAAARNALRSLREAGVIIPDRAGAGAPVFTIVLPVATRAA